ncbi:MAG: helix-turn-helix domain-containing protein [Alphaproteobacteria bacterium]
MSAAADWLEALRAEVKATSLARAAQKIGVSRSTVSEVLSGKYAASTAAIEQRVRGALLSETVTCPVSGEIRRDQCLKFQRQKPAGVNQSEWRLYHACRGGCPHSLLERSNDPC